MDQKRRQVLSSEDENVICKVKIIKGESVLHECRVFRISCGSRYMVTDTDCDFFCFSDKEISTATFCPLLMSAVYCVNDRSSGVLSFVTPPV